MFNNKAPKQIDTEAMTHEIVNGMMVMSDLLKPINEAVDAYRQQAIQRGYSPEAAEQFALTYHAYIFSQMAQNTR